MGNNNSLDMEWVTLSNIACIPQIFPIVVTLMIIVLALYEKYNQFGGSSYLGWNHS